jgi:hypothetical protein
MAKFPLIQATPAQPAATPPTFAQPWMYNLGGSGGFTFGATAQWAVQSAEGFGFPQMRHGDASRPWDHGEFSGLDLMPGRDIQLTLYTSQPDSAHMQTAMGLLTRWFTPPADGVTEQPFFFYRPTAPHASSTYMHSCMVRARQFELQSDVAYAYYHVAKPVAQLHATGALFYGPTQTFTWASSSTHTVANNGNMPVHPLFVWFGPIASGSTFSVGIGGNLLQFSLPSGVSMSSGDQLVVDTDLDVPSALYFPGGSGPPTSWLTYLTNSSRPFMLQPGNNSVAASVPAGSNLVIQWADGWAMAL